MTKKLAPKRGPNPNCGSRLKELWADPVWRAEAIAKNRAAPRAPYGPGKAPNGGKPYGVKRVTFNRFRKQARLEATLTMNKLEKAGVLDDADEQSREALHKGLEIMRNPLIGIKEQLAAARLILEWTKAKPAQKTELTVSKAEEWLEAVTEDNGAEETDQRATGSA